MSCNGLKKLSSYSLFSIFNHNRKALPILKWVSATTLLTLIILTGNAFNAQAQLINTNVQTLPNKSKHFQQALSLYKQKNYQQALSLFTKIDNAAGELFAGKSNFALGNFLLAKSYLSKAAQSPNSKVQDEANYTLALSDFQLHNYARELDILHRLMNQSQAYDIQSAARKFYNETLGFLTLEQRKKVFSASDIPAVQRDVVTSVFNKVDRKTAGSLLNALKLRFNNTPDSTIIQQLENKASTYNNFPDYAPNQIHVTAPAGISYSLGVALPKFEKDTQEYKVSQAIYNGIQLAVEKFNKSDSTKKVFIHYQNTLKNDSLPQDIMTELSWNDRVDMIIGPLYSEMAAKMAPMTEQYQIPLLAPLANSDSLNFDNPYVFQANPTFKVRGKQMADFAVKQLHLDTLAVITNQNSLGMQEAFAFRDEAERLGAKVRYFFSDNLEANGFDVSKYTQYFSTDSTTVDSLHIKPVQGLYLPLTGNTAPTLINLIFTDLEAHRSNVTVLGSQEWSLVNLDPESLKEFNIYYSAINIPDETLDSVKEFRANYRNRFGIAANKYAIVGYNCAKYLLETLNSVQNPALLKEALKNNHSFKGLSSHFYFDGTHINQAVEFYKMTPKGNIKVGISN